MLQWHCCISYFLSYGHLCFPFNESICSCLKLYWTSSCTYVSIKDNIYSCGTLIELCKDWSSKTVCIISIGMVSCWFADGLYQSISVNQYACTNLGIRYIGRLRLQMDLNIFSDYANKIWFCGRVELCHHFWLTTKARRKFRELLLMAYQQSVPSAVHLEYAVIETCLL